MSRFKDPKQGEFFTRIIGKAGDHVASITFNYYESDDSMSISFEPLGEYPLYMKRCYDLEMFLNKIEEYEMSIKRV